MPAAQLAADRPAAPPDPPPVPPSLRVRSPAARRLARLVARGALAPGMRLWERIGRYAHLHRRLMRLDGMTGWPGPGFGGYRPTARDAIVVTYPKSGTNLALQTLCQIAHGGAAEFRHIHDLVPWPEGLAIGRATLTAAHGGPGDEGTGAFRTIKTHLPAADLPIPAEPGPARWVYVVRDPADAFVSAYHFMRGLVFGPAMPSVESWLGTWLRDEFHFGSWAEHVAGFWPLRDRSDVLWLTFRGWVADPAATVDRLADFTGAALSPGERAAVLEKSSRAWMKAHDDRFRPGVSLPWADAAAPLVRRGVAGGSGDLLTPDQRRRLRSHSRAELRRLGCDLPFEELFGP